MIGTVLGAAFAPLLAAAALAPADCVNAEIGNISHMLVPTFPTVQRPNAMLRFCDPAHGYTEDRVDAFRLQMTGHRGRKVFRFRPYGGDGGFTWDQRRVTPYSYEVRVDSHDAVFRLAPGTKAAIATVTWEGEGPREVSFASDLPDAVRVTAARVDAEDRVEGRMRAWLCGEFDAAPESVRSAHGWTVVAFPSGLREVNFRYAVSYVSSDQAAANLAAEVRDFDRAALAASARDEWNRALSRIEVEGGTAAERRVFYTALWRTYERMVNVTEAGRYRGWDGEVHEAVRGDRYADDWIWDTYRAQHPLFCILDPAAERDKLNSYLDMAAQTREGWVPIFPQVAGDHHGMNGFHPPAIFLDAWRKGVTGVDWKAAFAALAHTERTSTRLPWNRGPRTGLDEFYDAHGYFPALAPGRDGGWAPDPEWPEWARHDERRQSVAVTLAYSFDAWCLAELAKEFGTPGDVAEFTRKSRFFENLWKPDAGFFHPKDRDGNWIGIGDYRVAGGQGARDYYDENNAWTYLWDVPHDIPRLMELMGGPAGMSARLDEMLNTGYGRARWEFSGLMPDSTAMMGMFSMGNEPCFHIPYLYDYTGEPWKAQKLVRKVLRAWFRDDLMGMPGDEDGGGMSAFVVFSMMGFYPVTPGSNEYALGSPVFTRVTVHGGGGRDFTVEAPGASEAAKYVRRASVDGRALARPFLSHAAVAGGGRLVLEMSERPRKEAW